MNELFEKIKELMENSKKTPYERYEEINRKIQKFSEEKDQEYLEQMVKNTMKGEIAFKEIQHINSIEFKSCLIEKTKREIQRVDDIALNSKYSRKKKYLNLEPSLKTEISYQYEDYNSWWKYVMPYGELKIAPNRKMDMRGKLFINENHYEFKYDYKKQKEQKNENNKGNKMSKKEILQAIQQGKVRSYDKETNSCSFYERFKLKVKEEEKIAINFKEYKIEDKNYFVKTPLHKEELIRQLIKEEDAYSLKQRKKQEKLKNKKVFEIERTYLELKQVLDKKKMMSDLDKAIKTLKNKKDDYIERCRELNQEVHEKIEPIEKAQQIGKSIINKAFEKSSKIKEKAYRYYQHRGLRRHHKIMVERFRNRGQNSVANILDRAYTRWEKEDEERDAQLDCNYTRNKRRARPEYYELSDIP